LIKYWGKIPKTLQKQGATVFLSNTNAFASHVDNAIQLRDRILEILDQTGAEKVNIIAHSKGGIESRYMISKQGMSQKVASLTTIATPHRGSYLADSLFNWMDKKNLTQRTVSLMSSLAKWIGDSYPDPYNAGFNLTVSYMENFNESVPDSPEVYYQSFGGLVTDDHPAWFIRFQEKIISEKEGPNDCTVSLNSYYWGNFKGIVEGNYDYGVSHFDIIGFKLIGKNYSFETDEFYLKICKDLKLRGF
jgi:triacylglycerol lipase